MKLLFAILGSLVAVQATQIQAEQFGKDLKEENVNFKDYETVQVKTELLNGLATKVNQMAGKQ